MPSTLPNPNYRLHCRRDANLINPSTTYKNPMGFMHYENVVLLVFIKVHVTLKSRVFLLRDQAQGLGHDEKRELMDNKNYAQVGPEGQTRTANSALCNAGLPPCHPVLMISG